MKSCGLAAAFLLLVSLSSFVQEEPAAPASQDKAPVAASTSATPIPNFTPGPDGKLSQEQMRQLFRVVAEKHFENQRRRRDYTYIDREVNRNVDGKDQTKSTEVNTYEILEIYGEPVRRLIEKDDKPLRPRKRPRKKRRFRRSSTSAKANPRKTARRAKTKRPKNTRTA